MVTSISKTICISQESSWCMMNKEGCRSISVGHQRLRIYNMSYGATVGVSAANSNFINFFKNNFYPSWINPMYTATFQIGLWTI